MKKALAGLIFGVLASLGTLSAQTTLLQNGSFETDTLGQLSFWHSDAFKNTDDARRVFTVESPLHTGKRSLGIVNLLPNDTRVVQWIEVEPDTYYRLSCWVMAENIAGGMIGANISILGSITPSASVKDTADKWVKLELTGKTGPGQTALAVSLRLGFYDNLVTGRVYFDDASAEKIAAPPAGAKVVDFGSNRGTGVINYQKESMAAANVPMLPLEIIVIFVLGTIGLFAIAFILGRLKTVAKPIAVPAAGGASAGRTGSRQKASAGPEMRRSFRKNLRINVTVKKPLRGDEYKLVELKSVNLSEMGLFLHSDDLSLFGVNEKLELAATYKRERYDLGPARVVRKQEIHRDTGKTASSGFGLEFVDTSAAQKNNLKKLLQ
jgi:hypothetical protein